MLEAGISSLPNCRFQHSQSFVR